MTFTPSETYILFAFFLATNLSIAALYIKLKTRYSKLALEKKLIESVYIALGYANEKPIAKGLEKIAKEAKDENLKRMLKREIAGEMLNGSLKGRIEEMFGVKIAGGIDHKEILRLIKEKIDDTRLKASQLEPVFQREATINMFISTILPSFFVLLLIGEVLNANSPDVFAFLFAFIVAMPLLYAAGLTLSERRFIDAFQI